MTDEHAQRTVNFCKPPRPVAPPAAAVRLELLKPLCFAGERVEIGDFVVLDVEDATPLLARGVAQVA